MTRCARCSTARPSVAIPVFQAPGSNAITISDEVVKTMNELQLAMPEGVKYEIVYDTTKFVRASIEKVVDTLLEAIALVVIVVILFLQTWRASIIPLIAVPVSIIGTFAVMYAFGFSINALSLFGLVLAIGIVVDDAIVVVENVERNIENGPSSAPGDLSGHEGSVRPDRRDRAGAGRGVRAAGLHHRSVRPVLSPVRADDRDLDRHLGHQLADAVPGSGRPSAQGVTDAPKDWLTRGMDFVFGWFFRGFNRAFGAGSNAYGRGVGGLLSRKSIVMVIYLALAGAHLCDLQCGTRRLRAGAGQAVSDRLRPAAGCRQRSTAPRTSSSA